MSKWQLRQRFATVGFVICRTGFRPSTSRIAEFGYKGVWQVGTVYRENNFVTDGGSVWVCIKDQATQRPGSGPEWKVGVKPGRDGRDARL